MEVRCGKCNKLFRVPDNKITGTGIKFACTGCGEYVKVTKEEFGHFSPSNITVSIPDKVEPKTQPVEMPLPPEGGRSTVIEPTSVVEPRISDLSTPEASYDFTKKGIPSVPVSSPSAESVHVAEPEPSAEPGLELEPTPSPEPQQEQPVLESKPEPRLIPEPQPAIIQAPKIEKKTESKLEPAKETAPVPEHRLSAESAALNESISEYVHKATTTVPSSKPSMPPTAPKKEPVRPVPHSIVGVTPPAPNRSGRMYMVLIIAFVMISLSGYGIFAYFNAVSKKGKEAASDISSIEGLHITSAVGSLDANGDLLITGVVENTTDKDKSTWYVVVEVYNAQGAILNKIRLLNGKQIHTRRDYEIFAKRGVNIQDLKEKSIQEHGVIIPPKSSVTFEMRYMQPPVGIANFNAALQPFDPIRLFKEIAADIR